jgi:hypothetical protein
MLQGLGSALCSIRWKAAYADMDPSVTEANTSGRRSETRFISTVSQCRLTASAPLPLRRPGHHERFGVST